MLNIVEDEVMNKVMISKEDFKKCFNSKKIISKEEYEEYIQIKIKSLKSC